MSELDSVMKALNKRFGQNYIGVGSEIMDTDYVRYPTGIFPLDYAVGGGLPERKIMMIAGKESSSKTSTALKAIASVQAQSKIAAFIDVEHGFDPIWAAKLGVQVDKLIIAQAKTVEEMSDTIEALVMTGEIALIVVDSVAAAPSQKELDDSADQKSMGGKAKAIGLMMGKLTARLNDVGNPVRTSIILLNQIRQNVGGWGAPEYCPGGKQLHFQCDIIVWLRPDSKPVGGKEDPQGITVKFKCTKNRTAPPFKVGTYDLLFEGKFDDVPAMIDLALTTGVVTKVGQKFTYGDKTVTYKKAFVESLSAEETLELKRQILDSETQVKVPAEDEGDDILEEVFEVS